VVEGIASSYGTLSKMKTLSIGLVILSVFLMVDSVPPQLRSIKEGECLNLTGAALKERCRLAHEWMSDCEADPKCTITDRGNYDKCCGGLEKEEGGLEKAEGGQQRAKGGLEWWGIVLIVLAVVVVIGIIVLCLRGNNDNAGVGQMNPNYAAGAYGQPGNVYGPPGNAYVPPGNAYSPPGNAYSPPGNVYGPPGNAYGPPGNAYVPPGNAYSPPGNAYSPPGNVYGPPGNAYGPPRNAYGSPGKVYGQPGNVYDQTQPTGPLGHVGGLAQTPQSVGAQEPPTPASGAESQHQQLGKA
jgi:hypothetical protein